MSRSAAKSHYITPIDATGAVQQNPAPAGVFTLAPSTTYYYVIPCAGSPYASVTMTSLTAAMVITSATVQDTDHPLGGVGTGGAAGVTDFANPANSAGVVYWPSEGNSSSAVAVSGTGWSATNGVIAATGAGLGAARFNIEGTAAFRTRLEVVVGATGGQLMVSCYEKA